MSDLINQNIPGSRSFTWHNALWLSRWQVHVLPTKQQMDEIIKVAFRLEQVKSFFGKEINVTSWLRPKLYNELINGSVNSQHIYGRAVNFVVAGEDCDMVRLMLEPRLEELKIRMERDDGAERVHIDIGEVKNQRYFYP